MMEPPAGESRRPEAAMEIHLLPRRRGRWRLYSPEIYELFRREATTETEESPGPPPPGSGAPAPELGLPVAGLAEGTTTAGERMPGQEEEAESGQTPPAKIPAAPESGRAARIFRAFLRWAKSRGGPSERLLREFRHPEEIAVRYPASLGEERAQAIYRALLEEAVRRHRRWLLVNGVLLPFSALLSLIPGPNLWLAYLAWRSLAHYQSRRGGRRALSDLRVAFVPDPALDPLFHLVRKRLVWRRKAKIRALGEALEIPDLERLV